MPAPPDSKLPLTIKFCCADTEPAERPSASPAVEIILMAMFFFIVPHFRLTISGVLFSTAMKTMITQKCDHDNRISGRGQKPNGSGKLQDALLSPASFLPIQ